MGVCANGYRNGSPFRVSPKKIARNDHSNDCVDVIPAPVAPETLNAPVQIVVVGRVTFNLMICHDVPPLTDGRLGAMKLNRDISGVPDAWRGAPSGRGWSVFRAAKPGNQGKSARGELYPLGLVAIQQGKANQSRA